MTAHGKKGEGTLPGLATLESVSVIGHVRRAVPDPDFCPSCGGGPVGYVRVSLELDARPQCNLFAAGGGALFITEGLLRRLVNAGACGYECRPIDQVSFASRTASDEVGLRSLPRVTDLWHLKVTGRCDGPWVRCQPVQECPACGRRQGESVNLNSDIAAILGDTALPPRLVYPETWHGEDFFHVGEPGPPIITDKIVNILAELGDLRVEAVRERASIRKLMPRYAEYLDTHNWASPRCAVLGSAAWVGTPVGC